MSVDWAACLAQVAPGPLTGEVLRLVESQEQVATNRLVRSLAEQDLLEELLESNKPAIPEPARSLHYLLATPFRYPPLRHGSRFGRRTEPSLFYASRTLAALLAECAYYRFVFWTGMAEPPLAPLTTQHSVFGIEIATQRGLRLQDPPFRIHRSVLTDPSRYDATQQLGGLLRGSDIEAFEYESARDREGGINVAIFTPVALAARHPTVVQQWLCETTSETVRWYSRGAGRVWSFRLDLFIVDGRLPAPAVQ